jgi:hypothetical protein
MLLAVHGIPARSVRKVVIVSRRRLLGDRGKLNRWIVAVPKGGSAVCPSLLDFEPLEAWAWVGYFKPVDAGEPLWVQRRGLCADHLIASGELGRTEGVIREPHEVNRSLVAERYPSGDSEAYGLNAAGTKGVGQGEV